MSSTGCSMSANSSGSHVVDDVVDDEDVFAGQIGLERRADVAGRGGDDLHRVAAEPLDLLEQETLAGSGTATVSVPSTRNSGRTWCFSRNSLRQQPRSPSGRRSAG